jgi:hypothetical protein
LIKAGIEIGGTATGPNQAENGQEGWPFLVHPRPLLRYGDGRIPRRYCAFCLFHEATGVGTSGATGTYARHQIALGGTPNFGRDTGEGASTADLAQGPSAISINTSAAFSAVGMLGRTIDGTIAQSICIAGDSTSVGYWDGVYGPNNGGWPWRACQNWPGMSIGCAGERLQQQVDPATFFVRFEIARWHTHILDCTLINDVTQSRTVAQMQADVLAQAYKFMSRGINYLKATCAPLADSTDGWFTVANQTRAQTKRTALASTTGCAIRPHLASSRRRMHKSPRSPALGAPSSSRCARHMKSMPLARWRSTAVGSRLPVLRSILELRRQAPPRR